MVFALCLTGKKQLTKQTNKTFPRFQIKCAKDLVFQNYGFEIQGLVEILGFSFELIGFHLK